jgi:RNA polymerase sigma-70 factor (ECF subfamily)
LFFLFFVNRLGRISVRERRRQKAKGNSWKAEEVRQLPEVEQDSTERILIDGCARRESGALAEVVRIYGAGVLGYLTKMCGRDQAEDLFQETFKRVYEKAGTIRGERIKPWLYAVATRLAMDSMRKKKKLKFVTFGSSGDRDGPETMIADDKSDPAGETLKAERKEQVRESVMGLPERMRATLIMAYYEGLSYAEIAECMGCSVGTVKTQMFRALQILADKLPEAE